MPCRTDGYPLYSWNDFRPFVEAYNAITEDEEIMNDHQNDMIDYYMNLREGFSKSMKADARFGKPLPLLPEKWSLGVSGYRSYDPRRNFETILCDIGRQRELPEGAQEAYTLHQKRDMKRYLESVDSLIQSLRTNRTKIKSLGGDVGTDYATTIKVLVKLRGRMKKDELTAHQSFAAISEVFDQSTVLKSKCYDNTRSEF
tara:strand:- start:462 stop:1061 length:600 start_codon:yes stop_codon:yes gene_type:complete